MSHDPHHVASLAAMILSSRQELPESHHIKSAVAVARSILDEACREESKADEAASAPVEGSEVADADNH